MDFFESQAVARRRTVILVLYYLLATLIVIPLVYVVVLGISVPVRATVNFFREWYDFHDTYTPVAHPGWWDATLFTWVMASTLVLMLGGTLYRLWQVSKGGYVIAEFLGGERIDPGTRTPEQIRLLNVVEEMAIASGLPVPDVYLIRGQHGINAFAAGFTPDDAVIGVTRGCLDVLSRDELQGVVAHEFSHILYGDTRLKTILVGLLHGLVYLGFMSNQVCQQAARGEPTMVMTAFLAFVVLGAVTLPLLLVTQIGIVLAGAIKRMVSWQREFLADAAAVQFTRNPGGIAGALKKVGGYAAGSSILSSGTGQASHFFFANALRRSALNWPGLSSHPPLANRIRRIEPAFSGEFAHVAGPPVMHEIPPRNGEADIVEEAVSLPINPDTIADSIGAPGEEHLAMAAALLAALPADLAVTVRNPIGAQGVIYALLLNRESAPRRMQLERLQRTAGQPVVAATQKVMLMLGAVKAERRLPLAALAVRSLKTLSRTDYDRFRENVDALTSADGNVDLFELALHRTIVRHLAPAFGEKMAGGARYRKLAPLMPACRDLLSCLAYWGSPDMLEQDQAFRNAMAKLVKDGLGVTQMLPLSDCSVETIGAALDMLSGAVPHLKKAIIDACVVCIAADGRTSLEEAELLQAIADSLDCPMPPVPVHATASERDRRCGYGTTVPPLPSPIGWSGACSGPR